MNEPRFTGEHAGDRLLQMTLRLFDGLHRAGVQCSLRDVLDASAALSHVDLLDRNFLRIALGATLVKRAEDLGVFHQLFDQCFPTTYADQLTPTTGSAGSTDSSSAPTTTPADSPGAASGARLQQQLSETLLDANSTQGSGDAELRDLAREAVQRLSGIGEKVASEKYFLQRVLRAFDLAQVVIDAMREARERGDLDAFELRQRRDDMNERIDAFKRMLAEEIRRQLFADVGVTGVGLIAPRRIEDAPVLDATKQQLAEMRAALRPLSLKLARKLAQRHRRHRAGRIDMRRTMRHSLVYGGVPVDLAFRRKRPSRPDVVVLCDISGSVAEFAQFTLMLLQALTGELRGLRTFVFVDGVAEITTVLENAEVDLDPRLLVTLPGVVVDDGHSDYEAALRRMLEHHGDALGPHTTLIVTGDARTNYRSPGIDAFRTVSQRVEAVYWFNPEPADNWSSHDSSIRLYAPECAGVFEVRTLAQLADAVAAIL